MRKQMKDRLELNGRTLISTRVILDMTGVGANALPGWVERGLLPTPIRLGNRFYYRLDLVEESLAKGE